MVSVVIPSRWRDAPSYPCEIDWSSPFAQDLRGAWVPGATPGRHQNMVSKVPYAITTGDFAVNPRGAALRHNSSGVVTTATEQRIKTLDDWTCGLYVLGQVRRTGANSTWFRARGTSDTKGIAFLHVDFDTTSAQFRLEHPWGGSWFVTSGAYPISGVRSYAFSVRGTSYRFYHNGRFGESVACSAEASTDAAHNVIVGGATLESMNCMYLWGSPPTDDFIRELNNAPFALLRRPKARTLYYGKTVSGGGTPSVTPQDVSTTLVAESPSVSFTASPGTVFPSDVALGLTVEAPAASGSFVVAPGDVALALAPEAPTVAFTPSAGGSATVSDVVLGLSAGSPTVTFTPPLDVSVAVSDVTFALSVEAPSPGVWTVIPPAGGTWTRVSP